MGKVHLIESVSPGGGVRTYCNRVARPGKKRGSYVTVIRKMREKDKVVPFRATHVEPEATCKLCAKQRQMLLFPVRDEELPEIEDGEPTP